MKIEELRKNVLLKPLLMVVSWIYGLMIDLRNYFFDTGVFNTYSFPIPVISVGNITTGGTGKTPFILFLIDKLLAQHKNLVVISRGYGRKSKGLVVVSDAKGKMVSAENGGDEPVMIAQKYPQVPVIVCEDRRNAIEYGMTHFNAELILLDDAFQHRKVQRDCNIVLVDAQKSLEEERMLPLGNMRENVKNIKRADIVVLAKVGEESNPEDKRDFIKKFNSEIFLSNYILSDFMQQNTKTKIAVKKDESWIGFSGIANPQAFKNDLVKLGLNLKEFIALKDHIKYDNKTVSKIKAVAEKYACKNLITTEKDLVKLQQSEFKNFRLFTISMKIEVENEEKFIKKVENLIDSNH